MCLVMEFHRVSFFFIADKGEYWVNIIFSRNYHFQNRIYVFGGQFNYADGETPLWILDIGMFNHKIHVAMAYFYEPSRSV